MERLKQTGQPTQNPERWGLRADLKIKFKRSKTKVRAYGRRLQCRLIYGSNS